jgi:hypothetical protein
VWKLKQAGHVQEVQTAGDLKAWVLSDWRDGEAFEGANLGVARLAAPYMHARLHAVAGTDETSLPPVRDEQSLAVIARKVALAFRLAVGEKAGLIEDAGDGGLTKP